jgi:hypothetical protein
MLFPIRRERSLIKIEMKGFDQLARPLERMARDVEATAGRLNRTLVSTPLTPDENGFVDRNCPSCSFLFKIASDSPSAEVRACPSCEHRESGARLIRCRCGGYRLSLSCPGTLILGGMSNRDRKMAAGTSYEYPACVHCPGKPERREDPF